jgi:hypothetical protein
MVCRVRRIRFRHRFGYGTLIRAGGTFLAVKTDGELVLFRDGEKGPEILVRGRLSVLISVSVMVELPLHSGWRPPA